MAEPQKTRPQIQRVSLASQASELRLAAASMITYATALDVTTTTGNAVSDGRIAADLTKGMCGAIDVPAGSMLVVYPFGTDAENKTGEIIVWRWMYIHDHVSNNSGTVQRHRFPLVKATFTLGANTGVASGLVLNTHFFADTIVIDNNRAIPSYRAQVYGPTTADNAPVGLAVDIAAAGVVEIQLSCDGSAASVNALYEIISGS